MLNRGFFTPWLLCRHLGAPLGSYLRAIYVRPVVTALPVLGAVYWLKPMLPGHSLITLALS